MLVQQFVFFGCYVHIILYCFFIRYTVVQQAGYFYGPPAGLGLYRVFVSYSYGAGGLYVGSIQLHFALVYGSSGLRACLKDTNCPEVFVKS